jgi:aryl-alcohol dehydrogenase-like predicted oxidoreductase
MTDRRRFLGIATFAALAISPQLLSAQQLSGKMIERTIPSSGEKIPVIGLAFSNHPNCADQTALKEVVKTFTDNGGKYFDATLGNMASQQFHARAASELGVANKVFWSSPAFLPGQPPTMGAAGIKAQIDSVLARTKASRIDVAWVNAAGPPELLAALKEEKKAGRVRYIGALTIVEQAQAAQLEAVMRNEPIDFIGVGYDIGNRFVEQSILPLALEKKIAVVAMFPFGNNSGVSCGALSLNLFARVGNRPVPEWAAEFDAKTWAQFFAKYVISHPAVTIARVGTTKPAHMLDNMAGGVGRLPNEATRKRMAALIDSLPKPVPPQRGAAPPPPAPGITLPVAILDRYVGEYKTQGGTVITIRREGDGLLVKPGNNPEAALLARTETRFQDVRGPFFDFTVDAQGKVTAAFLEQNGPNGPTRTPLTRTP